MLKFILPAVGLLACSPALAQSQAAQQQPPQAEQPKQGGIVFEDEQPASAKAKAARSRVICQDIKDPGSRLSSQRICMTAEQWKQQQEHDRDMLAQQQQQQSNPGAPGN